MTGEVHQGRSPPQNWAWRVLGSIERGREWFIGEFFSGLKVETFFD